MRKTLMLRRMELGTGKPKVCAPITGKTEEDILKEAVLVRDSGADLAEWRVDFFQKAGERSAVAGLAGKIRLLLGEMPIVFTCRTEGREKSVSVQDYIDLNKCMSKDGNIDMIDMELSMGDDVCKDFCAYAHEKGCCVIISSHDFEKTPDRQEIVARLCKMRKLGADVPKIAVMPQCPEDVLTLLSATREYAAYYAEGPLVTMAMGGQGVISRISGGIFGSALTFGSVLKESAPGQLPVKDVKYMLDILYKA